MALKIAISGFSGCGNTTVSKLVAERLRCKFLNYTLRNLAVDMGKPFAEVQQQAEIDPSLDYAVDKKQAVFSASSKRVVVGSRLACWLDDRRVLSKLAVRKKPVFDLKVWLDAPLKIRAERIAKREDKDPSAVLVQTRKRDSANARRYKKLYGIDVAKHSRFFKLGVSGISAEEAADRIVEKVKQSK